MIYVLSDIHGQKRRFDSIMRQINLQSEDTLYVLGDVIDRNPDGIRILRRLMTMPNARMLLGNHEHMMLDALYTLHDDPEPDRERLHEQRMNHWYRNGGKVTHDHLRRLRKSLRTEIFKYLDQLPLREEIFVNGKRFILVHAAPTELFEQYRSSTKYTSEKKVCLVVSVQRVGCKPL